MSIIEKISVYHSLICDVKTLDRCPAWSTRLIPHEKKKNLPCAFQFGVVVGMVIAVASGHFALVDLGCPHMEGKT